MTRLAIKASGMVTAVGFNSASSCAAMRAGIRNVNETNLWDAESGTYLTAGRVLLPHWWVGLGKLAELVAPAINECIAAARPVPATEIPILLGVASLDRPHRFSGLNEQILNEIEYRLGFRIHSASQVIAQDHISVLVALNESRKLIESGKARYCIVAAVDSLIEHELVGYFMKRRRLLTPKNSNGFCVGEAGGALLVGRKEDGEAAEIQVFGMGIAQEKATIESEEALRGDGLAGCIGAALRDAGLLIEDVHYRLSDLNGEHYKFKEMVFAVMRHSRKARPKKYDLFDLWHPAEFIGDPGAAIGPIALGVALHAWQKGYAPGPKTLCTFGNDNGERGAVIVGSESEIKKHE